MAKSSTSFKPGNKGGGRKGYEYEKRQLTKMKKLLNKSLVLAEKIQTGKANEKEQDAHRLLLKLILKIMDKLHASKQESKITGEGGGPIELTVVHYNKEK